jgi:hypothetical protein
MPTANSTSSVTTMPVPTPSSSCFGGTTGEPNALIRRLAHDSAAALDPHGWRADSRHSRDWVVDERI